MEVMGLEHLVRSGDVCVIAEIGNNHEGDEGLAGEMIAAAAESGATAVKFQTFRTEHFQSREDAVRFARLKGFELSAAATARLASQARSKGLTFISTPLDLRSAAMLEPLIDVFKVASGDLEFIPLLQFLAVTGKPVIISTGGSDFVRIDRAVSCLLSSWRDTGSRGDLALLHCVSAYPAPEDQLNLRAIRSLAARYPYPIGYSDHALGMFACVAAVALGARIIEKHFTLSKTYSTFRDHALSAEPHELRELVTVLRSVSRMLGDGTKVLQPCEQELATRGGRSIAAVRDLPAGHVVERDDLIWIRPAGGFAPGEESRVVGRTLRAAVGLGGVITPQHLT